MVDQGEERCVPGLLPALVWRTVKMERQKGKKVKGKEMNNGMIDSRQLLFNSTFLTCADASPVIAIYFDSRWR